MSEKEKKAPRNRAAAVIRIEPTAKAIDWLKGRYEDKWREAAEEIAFSEIEIRATGGESLLLSSDFFPGFDSAERDAVMTAAENAAEEESDRIRLRKRQESLRAIIDVWAYGDNDSAKRKDDP